jgi:hypothetical protein
LVSQTATEVPGSEAPEARLASRPTSPWFIAFLIAAATLSPVLTIWAGNLGLIPKLERLVLIACAYLLLGALVYLTLVRIIGDSRVATFVSFFTLLVLTSSGQVLDRWPWAWRWAAAVAAIGVLGVIVVRLRDLRALDVMVAALAAALLIPPLLSGGWAALSDGQPHPDPRPASHMPPMANKPDIVLVVLDGYTSLPVLREFFGQEDTRLIPELAQSGFRVIEPVFTPYSMTHLTLSSLLELDYVGEPGRSVADRLGGENRLVDVLDANGYEITMVEPGWHMSECGDRIDHCVPSPFVDESVDAVLSQSMFWGLIEPIVGSAFTEGARHAMSWSLDNIEQLVGNDRRDFLFVHVLAPHPPLFLDGDCDIVDEGRRRVTEFAEVTSVGPDVADARLNGYAGQVECVNHFVRSLAHSVVGSDAIVFVTGDHGSDALSQLATRPEEWSESQILDRMGTFLAVKAPPGCESTSALTTLSVFRSLISCTGDLALPPIEEKAVIVSRSEVEGQTGGMRVLDENAMTKLGACLVAVDQKLACS